MFKAPRGRSRQPMASTTAVGCSWNRPSVRFMAVTVLSAARSSTMVWGLQGMRRWLACWMKRKAYSGPVSSSLKVCSPKPLWMHWLRMPPSSLSRARMRRFSAPRRRASMAAARPAGPPPMMTRSAFFIMAPPSQRVLVDAYDDLRAAARLGDFGQGDAQFPREDLHDAGAAEARLAPAHAGPGAALDPVQAAGAGG